MQLFKHTLMIKGTEVAKEILIKVTLCVRYCGWEVWLRKESHPAELLVLIPQVPLIH